MIFGLKPRRDLPERTQPLEAIAVVKCLDEDGEMVWHLTATDGLTAMEGLGMLEAAASTYKRDIQEAWIEDDDDDNGS